MVSSGQGHRLAARRTNLGWMDRLQACLRALLPQHGQHQSPDAIKLPVLSQPADIMPCGCVA